ncbi:MAG TPA: thiamine pyrophosphate-binding protein [Ktedonobacteraceae bacterium]|nr:thiamine pyrophosphate-binding protein [Ktedonobacteraceae bacterium]
MKNRLHLTGAQAIIATLRAHHVDTIFGIPGVHSLPLYDSMRDAKGLRHVLARHEQGAGFMAEGYARITGRPGVVSTITGPGTTNAATPVASAFADSIPLLVISTAQPTGSIGKDRGELHELKNQFGVMDALAGWSREVRHVEEIPAALHDAMRAMSVGRPRGAYLQVPYDLLERTADVEIPTDCTFAVAVPNAESISAAAQLLNAAQQPVIIAGAGVNFAGANEQLARVAEALQAPIILGNKSHDVLPSAHPLAITTPGHVPAALQAVLEHADVGLVIGSKLGAERTDYGKFPLPRTLIQIDIDAAAIGNNHPVDLGIVGDARQALELLLEQLTQREHSEIAETIAHARAQMQQFTYRTYGSGVAFLDGVREGLPENGIIVADMTMLGYASALHMPVYEPRTHIHPSELCTIGCGLPLALGAKVAAPERPVVALCGDAGFLLNVGEMATAVQEKIPVVIVIFNDQTFSAVKKDQQRRFDQRYFATDVVEPNYVALAEAFHARGMYAETPDALSDAIRSAIQYAGPTLIEVPLPTREW